jgi:hypothetical protein
VRKRTKNRGKSKKGKRKSGKRKTERKIKNWLSCCMTGNSQQTRNKSPLDFFLFLSSFWTMSGWGRWKMEEQEKEERRRDLENRVRAWQEKKEELERQVREAQERAERELREVREAQERKS